MIPLRRIAKIHEVLLSCQEALARAYCEPSVLHRRLLMRSIDQVSRFFPKLSVVNTKIKSAAR